MTFFQLVSIFRSDLTTLRQVLQDPRWQAYSDRLANIDQAIANQDRRVLDASIPTELCVEAMKASNLRFKCEAGHLHLVADTDRSSCSIAAVDVYNLYGGAIIEEVIEFGSASLPSEPKQ
jgi:hypothetical protein